MTTISNCRWQEHSSQASGPCLKMLFRFWQHHQALICYFWACCRFPACFTRGIPVWVNMLGMGSRPRVVHFKEVNNSSSGSDTEAWPHTCQPQSEIPFRELSQCLVRSDFLTISSRKCLRSNCNSFSCSWPSGLTGGGMLTKLETEAQPRLPAALIWANNLLCDASAEKSKLSSVSQSH